MAAALEGQPRTEFTEPSKKILEGEKVALPDVSGMGYNEAKQTLEAAGFSTVEWPVFSKRKKGTFLGTSPTGVATKFSSVSLKVSAGPEPKPPPPPVAPVPPPVAPVPPPVAPVPPATPGDDD